MKFIQPVEITAEYKITTPMFLGGAFPTESIDSQQFRNASLKGALRFWWRALNWGRVLKASGGDEAAALKVLHAREGELFGKASDGKDSVQSRVQLRSELRGSSQVGRGQTLHGLNYLLGMGLFSHKAKEPLFIKGTLRPYLSGGTLTLKARLKPQTSQEDIDSIKETLITTGLFGAVGSRARKGFGSLAIQWIEQSGQRRTFNDLQSILNCISMEFSASADAPLSAFTRASRIDVSASGTSALHLLIQVGQEMQAYRDGTVPNRDKENNFPEDRVRAKTAAEGKKISSLPQRAAFGLPHNYHWIGSPLELELSPKESSRNRRASPLLIHIHEFPNGQCIAIQTLLPGRFLPQGTEVELKGRHSNVLIDPAIEYQVIHTYLDRFKQRKVLRHAQ
ncbi:type III-B CRISPR module RAMP protein Cmr1 [Azotobacter salinestris]|uniref:type III-B CRISPR module RAMP protein Cmr1 n=1 Tax=Azotobacter salinestris TaxID=69964 RepID=UPI0032DF03E2